MHQSLGLDLSEKQRENIQTRLNKKELEVAKAEENLTVARNNANKKSNAFNRKVETEQLRQGIEDMKVEIRRVTHEQAE